MPILNGDDRSSNLAIAKVQSHTAIDRHLPLSSVKYI
jgi:hypothetical protein